MSASSNVIWRGLRRVMQALRIVKARPVAATTLQAAGVYVAAPTQLTATIEIVCLIDEVREAETASAAIGVAAQIAEEPRRRASLPRPLARQLAYTASRNVPKGRKPQAAPAPVASGKRKISAPKAKPIVQNMVKKAPKRRHVWLCNESRVVRSIAGNVIPLAAARTRTLQKPGSQKTIRLLKLAA